MTTSATIRFANWIANHELTLAEVGQRLGCTFSHVCHLRAGRRRPGRALAVAIERLTGIPVEAWDEPTEDTEPSGDESANPEEVPDAEGDLTSEPSASVAA